MIKALTLKSAQRCRQWGALSHTGSVRKASGEAKIEVFKEEVGISQVNETKRRSGESKCLEKTLQERLARPGGWAQSPMWQGIPSRLQWGTQQREWMRVTLRETPGSKYLAFHAELGICSKGRAASHWRGLKQEPRWDQGFAFFHLFCVYKLHPESCPNSQMEKAARHKHAHWEGKPTSSVLLIDGSACNSTF